MTKYVALLRGIGPTNPNMRNEKLRGVFEGLGLKNVQTVISSGNVLFVSDLKDVKLLESVIEKAIAKQLGFQSTTTIRSQAELQKLVDQDPFKGLEHDRNTYLTVTFFKSPPKDSPALPYTPQGKSFKLITKVDDAICSVIDPTTGKTPDMMTWFEKQFGKEITTRTWQTVNRLLKKLNEL